MDAQPRPRPQIAVLGGINGAGKTTASQRILRDALRIPVFTNADAIARGLNAFDPESEAMYAGRIMLDHMRKMAAARRSFAFETTLAARTYARWLADQKRDGYAVHLFSIGSKALRWRLGASRNGCVPVGTSSPTIPSAAGIPEACGTFSNYTGP